MSLSVAESQLCCLLGPNGAGKTTLIRCVLGLLRPDAGSLTVAGQDTAALSARQLARLVAYVPQNTATVFPFTALEMVLMGRTPHLASLGAPSRADRGLAMAALERLGAGHFASPAVPAAVRRRAPAHHARPRASPGSAGARP